MKTSEFYLFSKTKRFYPGLCVGDNAFLLLSKTRLDLAKKEKD